MQQRQLKVSPRGDYRIYLHISWKMLSLVDDDAVNCAFLLQADGEEQVLVAGDPERIHMAKCDNQGGIPYHPNVINNLVRTNDTPHPGSEKAFVHSKLSSSLLHLVNCKTIHIILLLSWAFVLWCNNKL